MTARAQKKPMTESEMTLLQYIAAQAEPSRVPPGSRDVAEKLVSRGFAERSWYSPHFYRSTESGEEFLWGAT